MRSLRPITLQCRFYCNIKSFEIFTEKKYPETNYRTQKFEQAMIYIFTYLRESLIARNCSLFKRSSSKMNRRNRKNFWVTSKACFKYSFVLLLFFSKKPCNRISVINEMH